MEIINFEDGTILSPAKVVIDGNEYNITSAVWQGNTPISAYNLNRMQKNLLTYKYKIKTTNQIPENTDYEIPCSYKVGQDTLDIYYMGEKLIKGEHYVEVGENGTVSNKIQFYNWGQSVPIGRTIEFVVRGVYEDET